MLHKKDKTKCGNHRGVSLVVHAGRMLLKITSRLSKYCETAEVLPDKQCGFRSRNSTVDMMFVVLHLQGLGQRQRIPLYICFNDLMKAYHSVDYAFLWGILDIPPIMLSIIRQFHDGMRARVRTSDGEFLERFDVERGFHQDFIIAPILLSTAVLHVALAKLSSARPGTSPET